MKTKIFKYSTLFLILLCLQVPAMAATYYVNGSNSSSGSGLSWSTAYTDVQDAIDAASTAGGGDVWVAMGTYYIYSSSTDDTIELKDDVNVYGGFDGTETALSQRDYKINVTTLDGHYSSGSANQVKHVVTAYEADDVIFDGFTVTGGNSSAGAGPGRIGQQRATSPDAIFEADGNGTGGGMLVWRCAPTVNNCTFTYNSANKGGGVYVMVATEFPVETVNPAPTFTDCTFSYNTVSARGAGEMNDVASHPTFIRCKFIGNTCESKGGGMYNDFGCSPTLTNCVFAQNTAWWASAMGNDGSSSPTLTNCTITDNYAYDIGSGMYSGSYLGSGNEPTLVNCIVWGNENQWGGPRDFCAWHEDHFYITYSFIGDGFTSTGTGVIQDASYTNDPMFKDPDNGDYSLKSGSPCIDTGTASGTGIPSNDVDGNTRDSAPDMGAYEYTGTTATKSYVLTGFTTNATSSLQAGDTVTMTATAVANGETLYYRFGYKPDYNTEDWSSATWTQIQGWSTSNTASTTFPAAGTYILTVDLSNSADTSDSSQFMGGSVTIGEQTETTLTGISVNLTDLPEVGESLTISATASANTGDTVYYQFGYKPENGTWTAIQSWSTSSSCSKSFSADGTYIFTVETSASAGYPTLGTGQLMGGTIVVESPVLTAQYRYPLLSLLDGQWRIK